MTTAPSTSTMPTIEVAPKIPTCCALDKCPGTCSTEGHTVCECNYDKRTCACVCTCNWCTKFNAAIKAGKDAAAAVPVSEEQLYVDYAYTKALTDTFDGSNLDFVYHIKRAWTWLRDTYKHDDIGPDGCYNNPGGHKYMNRCSSCGAPWEDKEHTQKPCYEDRESCDEDE